jgi:hypothetical protein
MAEVGTLNHAALDMLPKQMRKCGRAEAPCVWKEKGGIGFAMSLLRPLLQGLGDSNERHVEESK